MNHLWNESIILFYWLIKRLMINVPLFFAINNTQWRKYNKTTRRESLKAVSLKKPTKHSFNFVSKNEQHKWRKWINHPFSFFVPSFQNSRQRQVPPKAFRIQQFWIPNSFMHALHACMHKSTDSTYHRTYTCMHARKRMDYGRCKI